MRSVPEIDFAPAVVAGEGLRPQPGRSEATPPESAVARRTRSRPPARRYESTRPDSAREKSSFAPATTISAQSEGICASPARSMATFLYPSRASSRAMSLCRFRRIGRVRRIGWIRRIGRIRRICRISYIRIISNLCAAVIDFINRNKSFCTFLTSNQKKEQTNKS